MRTKRWKKHANPCALCTDDTEAFKAHMLWDQWWLVSIFAALEAPCSSRGCDIHNFRNYSVITCAARHVTNTSTEKGNAKGRGPRRGVGGKRLGAQEPGTKDDDVRISKELSAFLLKIEIVGFVLALKSLKKLIGSWCGSAGSDPPPLTGFDWQNPQPMGVHPVDGHMVQFQGMKHCKMPTKQGQTPLLSTALNRSKAFGHNC